MRETYKGLRLDRFQREAIDAIDRSENVIVAAPTGAGKTLIAEYVLEQVIAQGKRAIYTAPIKALSNQKYRDLSALYPGQVGISTGDVSIDAGAPIVIMTTEIFRNTIFDDPERAAQVAWVIFDEVHYLDDPDRGTVWEESLIFAPPSVRVLALSATVSNLDEFADWIREVRSEAPTTVVLETERPVPLTVYCSSTEGDLRPLHQVSSLRLGKHAFARRLAVRKRNVRKYYENANKALVKAISARKQLPLLFFLYSRAACSALAVACGDMEFMPTKEASRAARAEFDRLTTAFELDPSDPDTKQLRWLASKGIAFHHAGILPPLKEVIERMFCAGHIRLLCCTETFALGINMPARSVAFEGVRKWNGVARVPLKTREYQQMAGRAGRRGIDPKGSVYLSFDPFNDEPSLVTNMVKGRVEPVQSQFNLSYGTLLNLYSRLGDEIYTACERSFSNFRAKRAEAAKATSGRQKKRDRDEGKAKGKSKESGRWREGRRGRNHGRGRRGRRSDRLQKEKEPRPRGQQRYKNVVAQVRIKLGILAELGYLDSSDKVTDAGRFAMQVFGHELVITELVFSGILEQITPVQIAVLATAIVHESRPNVFYGGRGGRGIMGKDVYRLANRVVGRLAQLEEDRGVRQASKQLDWNLSGTVSAWAEGAEFSELREYSDASDGDVVRTLRQAIQVLRLCGPALRALNRHKEAGKVKGAQKLLKRGLIDAEWQLRRASDVEDGETVSDPREESGVIDALPEETSPGLDESDADDSGESDADDSGESDELDADAAFSEGLL